MEKSGTQARQSDKEKLVEREQDATSKETVKDLEDQQKRSSTSDVDDKPPSPDGVFDEKSELKDADPL